MIHGLPLATMDEWKRVRLDGPYGKDHRLQNFETVLLTAKGMGIVGVLPFALHLAKRRRRDDDVRRKEARLRDSNDPVFGDLSRRVDLIWWLEDNDQEVWVSKQLKRLQVLDNKVCLPYRVLYVPDEHSSKSQQRLLVVWCVYPDLRHDKKMPFEANEYWKIRYNFNLQSFSRELRQEARYPGDTVLLCENHASFVLTTNTNFDD
ncbi:hypothetical protein QQS21_002087 [Conoideocrella luteorostrata]|uniref:Uncharacterized protein n=1 Tax=Conoideocrella luteorostrata TaxID=1105319 RepID=A0AAJ0G333_9HYPO|nr:hypothetical protein QQS21_002087 [Conoideocrella luteorostrata]